MGSLPSNDAPHRLLRDCRFGRDVVVQSFTNLYGCEIGDETRIGPFIEIQDEVSIGARCKIQSHTFICSGVVVEDEVFIGHGVMFVNDKRPRATVDGRLQVAGDWEQREIRVARGATIGSGATVVGAVSIGEGAMVGAGAVVTSDVPAGVTVIGVPAAPLGS